RSTRGQTTPRLKVVEHGWLWASKLSASRGISLALLLPIRLTRKLFPLAQQIRPQLSRQKIDLHNTLPHLLLLKNRACAIPTVPILKSWTRTCIRWNGFLIPKALSCRPSLGLGDPLDL